MMRARAKLKPDLTRLPKAGAPRWRVLDGLSDYAETLAAMEAHVTAMQTGEAGEEIWLVEHPPCYTAGTSAKPSDLLDPRFPVHNAGRGGEYTYHGPGQRVVYPLLNLATRQAQDVRAYIAALEGWMIAALSDLGVTAEQREDRVGLWVTHESALGLSGESKIAAIGVRVRRWITFHGVAINCAPDLSHFSGIVPCGITQHGVTSLADLGITDDMNQLDAALLTRWPDWFGPASRT
ncbi:MAG: lipoyl(octanoyl) transferase LipB [Alphaproteobacteria bacterium]